MRLPTRPNFSLSRLFGAWKFHTGAGGNRERTELQRRQGDWEPSTSVRPSHDRLLNHFSARPKFALRRRSRCRWTLQRQPLLSHKEDARKQRNTQMHEKWVFNWTIGRLERPRRLDHGGSQGLYGAGCPGSRTASTFSVALSTSETSMSSPLPSFIDFSARTHRQCQATAALPSDSAPPLVRAALTFLLEPRRLSLRFSLLLLHSHLRVVVGEVLPDDHHR